MRYGEKKRGEGEENDKHNFSQTFLCYERLAGTEMCIRNELKK